MSDEHAGPGRPRKYANNTEKMREYRKHLRECVIEKLPLSRQRAMADQLYKTHAREIMDTFIDCLEFKNRKPVIFEDKMIQFQWNVVRAKAFRKISLGGKLSPAAIVKALDASKSDYYNLMKLES